jgi:phosphoribosyl-ATP pyrophosphohydrolase
MMKNEIEEEEDDMMYYTLVHVKNQNVDRVEYQ